MEDSDFLNILSDLTNFNLAIFGISITIFTVLYAFILNRKDAIREMNIIIKSGKASPSLVQKASFFVSHIESWKELNFHVKLASIFSVFLFTIGLFSKYFREGSYIKLASIVLSIFSFILFLYIMIILIKVFSNYAKIISIE